MTSLRSIRPSGLGLAFSLAVAGGCSGADQGTWTLSDAQVSLTTDNHVLVDVIYVNDGGDDWDGSRCVIVDWEKGGVQSREDVRAQKQPTSPVEIVETERFCDGGNKALRGGDRDIFHITSMHLRDELAGSTVVVAAQDSKGTTNDDRATIPSP
jgi:hypothetical protein